MHYFSISRTLCHYYILVVLLHCIFICFFFMCSSYLFGIYLGKLEILFALELRSNFLFPKRLKLRFCFVLWEIWRFCQRVWLKKGADFFPTLSWHEYHWEKKERFLQQAWKLLLPCFCANVKSPSRKPIDTNCAFPTVCTIADRNTASEVNVCPFS